MQRRVNIWNNIDWTTVFIYLLLVFLGWINIYAAVYNEDHQSIFDFTQRYGKQLIWIFAAFLLIFIVFTIDIRFYTFFAYFIYGLMIFILLAVLILGKEVHGARSWFEIGNIRIQPSEFAKIATALALARYLSSYNVQINTIKSYSRIAFILFFPALLILLQNDTGSALVYFAFALVLFREGLSGSVFFLGFLIIILFIFALVFEKITLIALSVLGALIVFWILNRKFKQFAIALIVFVFSTSLFWGVDYFLGLKISIYYIILSSIGLSSIIYVYFAFKYKIKYVFVLLLFSFGSIVFTFSVDYVFHQVLEHHQQKRINTLLGLETDPLGIGYNVNQSKIAIGSGGFSGKGFLRGTQTKFNFVPEQSTDFIFCTIGEEWGFLGTFFVISLFVLLLLRLVYIAERQRSSFSRMYGYGVVAVIFFHVIINIGMTIGLMPVIGIPLPFFSYGGSSLWAFTILLFILLRLDSNRLELVK